MTLDWEALLARATDEFARITAEADPDADVSACPGWTVRDLVDHVGGIHQWARHAVVAGTPDGEPQPAPDDPAQLASWYAGHAADLREALAAAGPEAPAWTFGTQSTVGWWWRRQTHETLVHTRDLLDALGRVEEWSIAPELAWDGVREVATEFHPRQVRLGRAEPLPATVRLTASDLPDAAPVVLGDVAPTVDHEAPAAIVLLTLWRRAEAPDELARLLLPGAVTP